MPAGAAAPGLDLAGFSEATRSWFQAAFAEPTPAQAQAWGAIGRGENTLVIAPTGSGKTLAAFLWAIDKLAAEPAPAEAKQRCRVLYVSPLKALAVDVQRNLRSPLTGIGHAARRLGLPEPDIRVGVRTGDTAADERRKLAGKPPDILITTPESLFLMLTSRARDTLRSVQTVIIDEVHALAGGKRGAHLALSLERLDALRAAGGEGDGAGGDGASDGRQPVQRIGLSATVRPPEEVASFLGGARPVSIVAPPSGKQLELKIVVPVEDMADLQMSAGAPGRDPDGRGRGAGNGRAGAGAVLEDPGDGGDPVRQHSIWPHVEERVLDLIQAHRSTIVFANSRRLAERLCARLNELAAERAEEAEQAAAEQAAEHGSAEPGGSAGDFRRPAPGAPAEVMAQGGTGSGAVPVVARAHHGSVSRQERTQIEEALKSGRLPAVVATSSLELGIDMGAVDLVIQVESPPSVASGLQRTGRAGHNVGDISRGVFFPKYQGDLVQAAVVTQRMQTGQIEQLRMPRNPLDVLAQQIVAMTAMDDWEVGELEQTVRRAAPFSGLTRPVLDAVLDMLAGLYPSEDFGGLRPRLVWDRTTGMLRGRPGAQRIAVGNGGTIPDRGLFGVFLAGGQRDRSGRHSRRVGELDEEMVYESRVGDIFVLGASSWRIEDITADQVLVSPAPGQPGRLPFWHGDAPGRPAELGAAMGAYCRELGAAGDQAATAQLRREGLDELAAANLISYLAGQRAATGYLPDDRTLVIERFRDELGDWRLVLHSPYGGQVHAPWALAIAARLRERYNGMDVQAVHTDDGIIIRVPDADDPPPAGIAMLDPDEVEQIVTAELGASALFASRFRECAARALLLPRRQPGRRTPLWQQRQRSAQLLSVASQYGTFPIVLETVRECLQDVFDVPGLVSLMRDLSARKIRLVEVETSSPSPFSRSILFRYVGAFMYEGDAPLAERRAQALALDPALLADLLGQADMRELLDPLVVDETERELQRLAPGRACRDAEAVADMLRALGPLAVAEVAERSADPAAAPDWLTGLAAQRRVLEVRVAGQARWAAVEDAGRLRDALGVALPPGVPDAFTEPVPDPLRDLVLRYARTHGPFTAPEVAERYGLGVAVVAGALHRLTAEGTVAEGEFRPGGRGTEWCEAGVLRQLRRRCLAKLRKEVEPVSGRVLAAFLPAWQRAGRPPPSGQGRPGSRPGAGGAGRAWAGPAGTGQRSAAGRAGQASAAPGWGQTWAAAGSSGPRGAARLDAVYEAIEQLAGAVLPASALETLVLPGRVPGYSPALLDELTSAGEIVWTGAGALPGGDGWLVLAPAETAPLLFPGPGEITMTPAHEAVLAVLDGGGALFFRGLADRAGQFLSAAGMHATDQAVASAIWDLVWAGRLTNDTLAPLRTVLSSGRPVAPAEPGAPAVVRSAPGGLAAPGGPADPGGTGGSGGGWPRSASGLQLSRRGRGGRRPGAGRAVMPSRTGPPAVSGRWSMLPPAEPDPTRRLHAMAITLLERHGIVLRGIAATERVPGGFSAIYPVLRAMEDGGQCRRGYFVEGLGAAQFALPGAVDRMRALGETLPEAGTSADDGAGQGRPRPGEAGRAAGGGPGSPGLPEPDWYVRPGWGLPAGPPAAAGEGNGGPPADGSGPDVRGPGGRTAADPGAAAPGGTGPGGTGPGGPEPGGTGPGGPGHDGAGLAGPGNGSGADDAASRGDPAVQVNWTDRSAWASEASRARNTEPPVVVLSAADPANAYGAALPWPERPEETAGGHRPGRKSGALVILCHGDLVLYVERGGKTLLSWSSDPAVLEPAARALATAGRAGALGRLTVERADGETVYDSPLAQALEAAGFRPTPRGLRLRG
jgi:ATP-dependent Lhr-like helicase